MSTAPTTFERLQVPEEDRVEMKLTAKMVKTALLRVQRSGRRTSVQEIANQLATDYPTAFGWQHQSYKRPSSQAFNQSAGMSLFHVKVDGLLRSLSCFFSIKAKTVAPNVTWYWDPAINLLHPRLLGRKDRPKRMFLDEADVVSEEYQSHGIGDVPGVRLEDPEMAGLSDIENECDAQTAYYGIQARRHGNREGTAQDIYTHYGVIAGLQQKAGVVTDGDNHNGSDSSDVEDETATSSSEMEETAPKATIATRRAMGTGVAQVIPSTVAERRTLCRQAGGSHAKVLRDLDNMEVVQCSRCLENTLTPALVLADMETLPASFDQLLKGCGHIKSQYELEVLLYAAIQESGKRKCTVFAMAAAIVEEYPFYTHYEEERLMQDLVIAADSSSYLETTAFSDDQPDLANHMINIAAQALKPVRQATNPRKQGKPPKGVKAFNEARQLEYERTGRFPTSQEIAKNRRIAERLEKLATHGPGKSRVHGDAAHWNKEVGSRSQPSRSVVATALAERENATVKGGNKMSIHPGLRQGSRSIILSKEAAQRRDGHKSVQRVHFSSSLPLSSQAFEAESAKTASDSSDDSHSGDDFDSNDESDESDPDLDLPSVATRRPSWCEIDVLRRSQVPVKAAFEQVKSKPAKRKSLGKLAEWNAEARETYELTGKWPTMTEIRKRRARAKRAEVANRSPRPRHPPRNPEYWQEAVGTRSQPSRSDGNAAIAERKKQSLKTVKESRVRKRDRRKRSHGSAFADDHTAQTGLRNKGKKRARFSSSPPSSPALLVAATASIAPRRQATDVATSSPAVRVDASTSAKPRSRSPSPMLLDLHTSDFDQMDTPPPRRSAVFATSSNHKTQGSSRASSPPSLSLSNDDTDVASSSNPTSEMDVNPASDPAVETTRKAEIGTSGPERLALAPLKISKGAQRKNKEKKQEKRKVPKCMHGIPKMEIDGMPGCMVCGLADMFKL